tara:strand:+ start:191 stop:538 length:348 start_codon:yes stop_codon:yes gene_type:complete
MRTWKDKIWQLALVIVGASILSVCNISGNKSTKNDNGLAYANGFKPSDISAIMICDGYASGQFTGCYKDSSSSSFNITLSSLFSSGWRPVGPLYSPGSATVINQKFDSSPTIFYK